MPSPSSSSSLNPALLPVGTQVGPFRIVDWAGKGVHGAVYRAVRIGQEHLPPVALKVALLPEDPRVEREHELLSRTLHPHIPRLVEYGLWKIWHLPGRRHPHPAAATSGDSRLPLPRGLALHPPVPPHLRALQGGARG